MHRRDEDVAFAVVMVLFLVALVVLPDWDDLKYRAAEIIKYEVYGR